MKITKSQLNQIIKEEMESAVEGYRGFRSRFDHVGGAKRVAHARAARAAELEVKSRGGTINVNDRTVYVDEVAQLARKAAWNGASLDTGLQDLKTHLFDTGVVSSASRDVLDPHVQKLFTIAYSKAKKAGGGQGGMSGMSEPEPQQSYVRESIRQKGKAKMKITKSQLQQIIKEELEYALNEWGAGTRDLIEDLADDALKKWGGERSEKAVKTARALAKEQVRKAGPDIIDRLDEIAELIAARLSNMFE